MRSRTWLGTPLAVDPFTVVVEAIAADRLLFAGILHGVRDVFEH
jgi:hypothetical protein